MLSRTEIERLAAAAHALRPDWPVRSLCTWLQTDHAARAYRDVAVALAYIATDAATQTPKRMNEMGPWWSAVKLAGSDATDHRFARCDVIGHGSYAAWNCGACRAEQIAADDATPTPTTPDPERAAIASRGAQQAREALADALAAARQEIQP
ncbi:hypothetical protein [Cellulomonas shaoxiangyii]|uniref:Uncharacterized protein n=1 Tax=Cellulomonas shaoxiangyii TaxID=2566013 RepID=A0A4P7SJN1_9CELL|nr:hypothetical protein [Cellulomonas shaoxiangyii]QCB93316.1 hypothetical protein E5225_06890 [Cellulomonas shaoxiangyii]TGY79421.1 hypothetical protein E5226_15420 [Cellulomonas shaoxiangyii]